MSVDAELPFYIYRTNILKDASLFLVQNKKLKIKIFEKIQVGTTPLTNVNLGLQRQPLVHDRVPLGNLLLLAGQTGPIVKILRGYVVPEHAHDQIAQRSPEVLQVVRVQ